MAIEVRLTGLTANELRGLKDQYVSGEFVLPALTRDDDRRAGRALADSGVTRERVLQAIAEVRPNARPQAV